MSDTSINLREHNQLILAAQLVLLEELANLRSTRTRARVSQDVRQKLLQTREALRMSIQHDLDAAGHDPRYCTDWAVRITRSDGRSIVRVEWSRFVVGAPRTTALLPFWQMRGTLPTYLHGGTVSELPRVDADEPVKVQIGEGFNHALVNLLRWTSAVIDDLRVLREDQTSSPTERWRLLRNAVLKLSKECGKDSPLHLKLQDLLRPMRVSKRDSLDALLRDASVDKVAILFPVLVAALQELVETIDKVNGAPSKKLRDFASAIEAQHATIDGRIAVAIGERAATSDTAQQGSRIAWHARRAASNR